MAKRKKSAPKVRGSITRAKSDGPKQPNILVIWGDDIGQSNLSCYTHGLMGYKTPNIDRIAKSPSGKFGFMTRRLRPAV